MIGVLSQVPEIKDVEAKEQSATLPIIKLNEGEDS